MMPRAATFSCRAFALQPQYAPIITPLLLDAGADVSADADADA